MTTKSGLLELKPPLAANPQEGQDIPTLGLVGNFERPTPLHQAPLSESSLSKHANSIAFLAIELAMRTAGRLIWTIWTYRAVLNELDSLSEADLRDLRIKPSETASFAWREACRRSRVGAWPDPRRPA